MRRALHSQLPALAHYFHVRPWEVDFLSYREIAQFQAWLARLPWPPTERR